MNTLTTTARTGTDFSAFTAADPIVAVKARGRRLPWRRILGGSALLVAFGAGIGGYLYHAAGYETTDDSFLEGNVHPVSPRISGTVARVLVSDNAHVTAGQPLVELDPADLSIAAQSAEAELARARANETQVTAQIARARADVDAATARIAQSAAQLNHAELDFHRAESLLQDASGAISQQSFDAARAAYDAAKASQSSLIAERNAAEGGLAAAQAQRAVAAAQTQTAEAALRMAKLQVDYTIIRAPNAGRVAKKNVEVGQRLQPGQPVLAVVSDDTWVVANFKESQLKHLRVGQNVDVKVDAIAGRTFHGVLESFSPGTGARFSLLPPDNSTGNFTKIVQRVPVKIVFSPDSVGAEAARLAPGLSADVTVQVRP